MPADPAPPASPSPAPTSRIVPLIVACALFMENLDSTVIATALPTMARSLGEDPLRLSMAITAYLLSLAVFIPLSGWMADRFGARRVFRTAILIFTLGSVCCGLSQNLAELVAARILQGMGGAMMTPVGRLVLLRSTPKAELVRAMAWFTVPALLGPVLGPPVGGFIVTHVSWRWIFFVNVPIGLLGMLLAGRFIPEIREDSVPPLDLTGFVWLALGLSGAMFGLETVGRDVLPPAAVAALLTVAVVALALYVRHARRVEHPLLGWAPMRISSFGLAIIGGSLFRIGIGAIPFLLPLMLQAGFGMSALRSGLLTFVSAAGAMGMKLVAQIVLARFGFRPVLVVNGLIASLFLVGFGLFRPDTPHAIILAVLFVSGFFRSLQFTAVNTLAFADMPRALMSAATSFSATAQQMSLSLGVVVGAMALHLARLAADRDTLTAADFWPAFLTVGVISLLSVPVFLRLSRDAGDEVSGHRSAQALPERGQEAD